MYQIICRVVFFLSAGTLETCAKYTVQEMANYQQKRDKSTFSTFKSTKMKTASVLKKNNNSQVQKHLFS